MKKLGLLFMLGFLLGQPGLAQPQWVYSGAPLGDTCVNKYQTGGLASTDSFTLKHALGQDSLMIKNITGSPSGCHIYRVDKTPNVTCSMPNMTNNDRYFGVFVIEGTNPTYMAKYFYISNPYVNAGNRPFLRVYERTDNSVTSCGAWSDMNGHINYTGDTISKNHMLNVQREMILTYNFFILPITLLDFSAAWMDEEYSRSMISWTVGTENNLKWYEVERSADGFNWALLNTIPCHGVSLSTQGKYSCTDQQPGFLNYYRLKSVDNNGQFEYSKVVMLSKRVDTLYISGVFPNPATAEIQVNICSPQQQACEYGITDCLGREVLRQSYDMPEGCGQLKIPVSELARGAYFLHFIVPDNRPASFCKPFIKK